MPRWKELPASLDEQAAQFVVQLRRLKDRSGLSLAALAAKTSYSRSSWERYLNGRQLPPRDAVEELARVCATDPVRLLVLHELAAAAWPAQEPAAPAGARRIPSRALVVAGAVTVLVVALAAGLLIARPWQGDDGGGGAPGGTAPSPFVFVQGRSRPCEVRREDGELRAGYSPTRSVLMDLKSSGWEVLEAQCLLRHHGHDPGLIDGSYGPKSKAAAQDFQKDRNLVVDGIVGPDTWAELRR
ncbi:helix-turn-helix domain-containing protein [Streptomyces sp. AV19]|uniref:helix-turn-helix domain-containing protein n=1 Tax=Streptomyces sp. AV19 TaxID=2793068 RepID=UPI0018FE4DD3|nr:helix-turn-helix domain-containing protein [Streptomyces sp. AV19]MBH1935960.1 helix-turn-helix domain-containing protein [Streptomyces sp. AV19]MDG4534249.1 helix-turn-helix domain-containing protein [Streptomyces sp. AV19]